MSRTSSSEQNARRIAAYEGKRKIPATALAGKDACLNPAAGSHSLNADPIEPGQAEHRLFAAFVFRPDSEPLVTISTSRSDIMRQLAAYVAGMAPQLLWPEDAERVATLLDAGDRGDAVQAYFDALDDPARKVRWERQRLVIRSLPRPADETRGHDSQERTLLRAVREGLPPGW